MSVSAARFKATDTRGAGAARTLLGAVEDGLAGEQLGEDAPDGPDVDRLRVVARAEQSSSGARYQNVTTTGSRSASGFSGALNSRAKPCAHAHRFLVRIYPILYCVCAYY